MLARNPGRGAAMDLPGPDQEPRDLVQKRSVFALTGIIILQARGD